MLLHDYLRFQLFGSLLWLLHHWRRCCLSRGGVTIGNALEMSIDVKFFELDDFCDPLALLSDLFYDHNDHKNYDDSDEDSACVDSNRHDI